MAGSRSSARACLTGGGSGLISTLSAEYEAFSMSSESRKLVSRDRHRYFNLNVLFCYCN